MHDSPGFERLARFFLCVIVGGERELLIVDQRQKRLSGVRVSFIDGTGNSRYIFHGPAAVLDEVAPTGRV